MIEDQKSLSICYVNPGINTSVLLGIIRDTKDEWFEFCKEADGVPFFLHTDKAWDNLRGMIQAVSFYYYVYLYSMIR